LLHLDGDRRLRGWPEQWPDQPDKGFFILAEPEWVLDDQTAPLYRVKRFVVPATEVKMVEFLLKPEEVNTSQTELDRVSRLLQQAQNVSKGDQHGSASAQPSPE